MKNNRKTQKRRVRGGSGSVNEIGAINNEIGTVKKGTVKKIGSVKKIGENINDVLLKKLKQKLDRTKNIRKYFIQNIDIYLELKYDCKNICKKTVVVVDENQKKKQMDSDKEKKKQLKMVVGEENQMDSDDKKKVEENQMDSDDKKKVEENQMDSDIEKKLKIQLEKQMEDMMKNKPDQDWGNFCKNLNIKKCQQFIQKRTELDFIYFQVKTGPQYSKDLDLKKDIETLYFKFVEKPKVEENPNVEEKPKVEENPKVENFTPGLFTNSKRYTKKNTAMKNINENTAMKNTAMKNTTMKNTTMKN
jgi:hypothetical protein